MLRRPTYLFAPIKKEMEKARDRMRAKHYASRSGPQRKKLKSQFKVLQSVHMKLGFGRLENFEL